MGTRQREVGVSSFASSPKRKRDELDKMSKHPAMADIRQYLIDNPKSYDDLTVMAGKEAQQTYIYTDAKRAKDMVGDFDYSTNHLLTRP